MENDMDKSKEPFPAENTPTPPQVMDPRKPPVKDEERSDESNSTVPAGDADKRPASEKTGKE